jgi:hypothetical protein
VTLILAGIIWHWAVAGTPSLEYGLPETNVGAFFLADLREVAVRGMGPRRLIDLGLGVLMLTPYIRVLASLCIGDVVARPGRQSARELPLPEICDTCHKCARKWRFLRVRVHENPLLFRIVEGFKRVPFTRPSSLLHTQTTVEQCQNFWETAGHAIGR